MANRRQKAISRSVQRALFRREYPKTSLIKRILAFFRIFYLTLIRYEQDLFQQLRTQVWDLSDEEYFSSFKGDRKSPALVSMGDLGFSGSVSTCSGLVISLII